MTRALQDLAFSEYLFLLVLGVNFTNRNVTMKCPGDKLVWCRCRMGPLLSKPFYIILWILYY